MKLNLLTEELPREKLLSKGPKALTQVELLAILLRTGTKDKNVLELSREILSNFSPRQVSNHTFDDLKQYKGIAKAKACQIIAAFELSKRLSENKEMVEFSSSTDTYKFVKLELESLDHEEVHLLILNSRAKLIKKEFISKGTNVYSFFDTKKIIKSSIDNNAYSIVLIHNHPSGDSNPSKQDIEMTNRIKLVLENLQIKLLDHIIIGQGEYFSFLDNDLI